MKILRELLAELKRSNDLKEKEIDFKTMSDMDFEQKYKQSIPLGRRQEHFSTAGDIVHTNTNRSGWF
jgi:hypothetical protein|tara:strand:- start:1562 stop:1762 length:201 start_codon:yes stop_codon:yes gene_type:complete